jgi:uncharacterized protein (DUF983 family)
MPTRQPPPLFDPRRREIRPPHVPEPDKVGERTLGAMVRLRCPICWRGAMFRHPLAMHERCANCGRVFDRGHGYFLGAMYASYSFMVVGGAAAAIGCFAAGWPMTTWLPILIASTLVVGPLVAFPLSRWWWVWVEHRWGQVFHEGADDPAVLAARARAEAEAATRQVAHEATEALLAAAQRGADQTRGQDPEQTDRSSRS